MPKDGPSAGVTLPSALISALSGRSARADTCTTGEITLQGRVLPVGGIKEKILAGVARGLKHVIIPSQNVKDLEEVPKELLKKIKVHPAHTYDDVLAQHLQVMDSTATSLSMDISIPVILFALEDPENILRVVHGEKSGTIVKD